MIDLESTVGETQPLDEFVEEQFLGYAEYVIRDRAICSIRDGLKPSQRRILYQMYEMGLKPSGTTVKSAKVSSSCMANYHPHGDASLYGTMADMAATFKTRLAPVYGHGNFGFTVGDSPAAPRYTEVKVSESGWMLLEDLKYDTVPMVDNYDATLQEPEYLPVKWPMHIINGYFGVAVGYAANAPSHNPTEVMKAVIWLAKHGSISDKKLLEIMPGPDFQTEGIVYDEGGIAEYYNTGRGSFVVRGKTEVSQLSRGRHAITVSSLPPDIPDKQFIQKVKELVAENQNTGITNIQNLTDKKRGLNIVISLKSGTNPERTLNMLWAKTPLQSNVYVNANILSEDDVPVKIPMKEQLAIFLKNRDEQIVRKHQHIMEQKNSRLDLVKGLRIVLVDIDAAIKIIRNAENPDEAKDQLIQHFVLTDNQAQQVLSLQLRRLTKLDSNQLKQEQESLESEIAELSKVVGEKEYRYENILIPELQDTMKKIASPRKTEIISGGAEVLAKEDYAEEEQQPDEATIYLTANGISRKEQQPPYLCEPFEFKGKEVIALSSFGLAVKVPLSHITKSVQSAIDVLPKGVVLEDGDEIVAVVTPGSVTAWASRDGQVKLTPAELGSRTSSVKVTQWGKDTVYAGVIDGKKNLLLVAENGKALSTPLDKIRPQGASAGGVAGMAFPEGVSLVDAYTVDDEDTITTATNDSYKQVRAGDIPTKGRGGQGVTIHGFRKTDTQVLSATIGSVTVDGNPPEQKDSGYLNSTGIKTGKPPVVVRI